MKIKCGHCQNKEKATKLCNDLCYCEGCGGINAVESKKSYTLLEWLGFNFQDYMSAIFSTIETDKFELIKAKTTAEIKAGKFTDIEVEKLREVMDDGFRKERTIREIAEDIDKKVKPRDLYQTKDGEMVRRNGKPILRMSAGQRPIMISRTETTRLANLGALEHFKDQKVEEVVFTASYGDRTCAICLELDGRIFPINQTTIEIPVHPMCRCTWINKM